MNDPTLLLYIIITTIAIYGFCLFFWWGVSSTKRPNSMYWYVTFMLFGTAVNNGIAGYVRYLKFGNDIAYHQMLESDIWPLRLWLLLFCVFGIVAHGSVRYFRSKH